MPSLRGLLLRYQGAPQGMLLKLIRKPRASLTQRLSGQPLRLRTYPLPTTMQGECYQAGVSMPTKLLTLETQSNNFPPQGVISVM